MTDRPDNQNQPTFNQQGQHVQGDQYNVLGNVNLNPPRSPHIEQFAGLEVARRVEALIAEYTNLFVGRTAEWQQIDDFAFRGSPDQQTLVITANAGFGKSALLANWAQRQRTNGVFMALTQVVGDDQPTLHRRWFKMITSDVTELSAKTLR